MIINSLPCCCSKVTDTHDIIQNNIYKLIINLTELFNNDINLQKSQEIITQNNFELYINESFVIDNFIYNEIYTIKLNNKTYFYRPISTIYMNYILLDSIEFILNSINIQKEIKEMIKIISIIVFNKDKNNNIICGYLMEYINSIKISNLIYEPLYWYFNGKTINKQIFLLLDILTNNKVRPFNLTYNDLLWNKNNNLLSYIGPAYYSFYHPFNNEKIRMHNDIIKIKLKEVEIKVRANIKFINFIF
jgi:hypothetical protein